MPSFVDVDFSTQSQYVPGYSPGDGRERVCGSFGDSFELIPEKDWKELANLLVSEKSGLSWLVTRIYNQSNEGSCVGNAGAQAHENMQAQLAGRDRVVPISAMSMYKQIGSSPNSGANVGTCVSRMNDTGFLPLDTDANKQRFKHTMSHTGFRQSWPSGWKETAAMFAGIEGYECESVNAMVSALFRGMRVIVGRAGHSILYLEPFYDGSTLCIDYVNSWGDWGFGKGNMSTGFGRDTARLYRESADWCYAFAAPDPSKWNWLFEVKQ